MLTKLTKALDNIKVGAKMEGETPDGKMLPANRHDYSHVLPKDLRDKGYGIQVHHTPDPWGGGSSPLVATATHDGKEIARLPGKFTSGRLPGLGLHTGYTSVDTSNIADEAHQGLGLRSAMHTAIWAHGKNALGATHDFSTAPLSKLEMGHREKALGALGLTQHKTPVSNPEGTIGDDDLQRVSSPTPLGKSLYDDGVTDEVHRMMAIPEERALALKMKSCNEEHLVAGLQYPDIHSKILGHKLYGGAVKSALVSDPKYQEHWAKVLPTLNAEHLHILHATAQGLDCESNILDSVVKHPECALGTAKALIDLGHVGALAHPQIEKWVLDMFVHWHVEHPENSFVADVAREVLANPKCSEHCYKLAMSTKDFETQLAVLRSGFYLPEDECRDILVSSRPEDVPLKLAVVGHPLCTRSLLELGAVDKSALVRTVAKPRLIAIMTKEGALPSDIAVVANPEMDTSGNHAPERSYAGRVF